MNPRRPEVRIDLDASGKQLGEIEFALEQPWDGRDSLVLPACVIAHGEGPTIALLGGNHGDEYEGPLVLGQLIRELDPAAVQGRLIILPAINPPAMRAHTRASPLDGENLNRIWPGDPRGTPSERIVAWIDQEVYSRASVLMDLHTGGNAIELIEMSMCHWTDDPERRAAVRAAQEAFNAPLSVELRIGAGRRTAAVRAHERGLLVVGSESGGGGVVNPATLANGYHGVRNVLDHLGVLPAPVAPGRLRQRTRYTRKWGHEAEMVSDADGVFVPFHRLWDEVEEGQPAGQLFTIDAPQRPPRTLGFPAAGLIAGRLAVSGVHAGDLLYWIVQDL